MRRTALVGNAGTGAEWIKVLNSRAFNMYPHEFNCFSDRMYDQWSVYGQLPEVVAYAQDGTHLLFLGWYVPAIQYVPPNMSKYNGI